MVIINGGAVLVCDCLLGDNCYAWHLCALCVRQFELQPASLTPSPAHLHDPLAPVDHFIREEGFVPSRRLPASTVGLRVTAARQPVHQVLPQLVSDGLSPGDHLDAAMDLVHLPAQTNVFALLWPTR